MRDDFIQWSRDGSTIVFYWRSGLYQAGADGSAVRRIDTDSTMGRHAFGLSPDGRQIVYSGCQIREETVFDYAPMTILHKEYRLVRADIGGGWPTFPWWPQVVAERHAVEIFPSWSPDGERIAFQSGQQLMVMGVNGSKKQAIDLRNERLYGAPQWSPDSQRLAVTAATEAPRVGRVLRSPVVYTVGADGSDPRRLVSGVFSAPSWSPDGQWLAYARINRGELILAAIRVDGTDERQLATIPYSWAEQWLPTVAWSPDGAHILYSCHEHLCVVRSDGRPVGRTPSRGSMGAWSPDGSRFAVAIRPGDRPSDEVLYTVAPDGRQRCPLVRLNTEYVAPTRNVVDRLWRTIFGGEIDHPLVPVRDCGAGA